MIDGICAKCLAPVILIGATIKEMEKYGWVRAFECSECGHRSQSIPFPPPSGTLWVTKGHECHQLSGTFHVTTGNECSRYWIVPGMRRETRAHSRCIYCLHDTVIGDTSNPNRHRYECEECGKPWRAAHAPGGTLFVTTGDRS